MAEPFPVSGNIDPNTFPFFLADLHRREATGSLKVQGPVFEKQLFFRGGRILFGSSKDPGDQLGAILIEQDKITQEQLDEVNSKLGTSPLAKMLAESGYVNQRELGEAARIKVERILSDVIGYTSGTFEFEDGVLPKGAVDLKLSTEKLMLSAVRRLSDRAFALRHLDSLGVVLAPTRQLEGRIDDLRAEAADLPDRLDGQRTLKEAAALTHLEEFEAAKVACGLLFLGLVRRAEDAEGAGEGAEIDMSGTAHGGFAEPLGGDIGAPAPHLPAEAESPSPFFTDDLPSTPPPRYPEAEPGSAFAITPPPPADFPLPEPAPFMAAEPFSAPPAEPPPSSVPSFTASEPEPARPVFGGSGGGFGADVETTAFTVDAVGASAPAPPSPPAAGPAASIPPFPSFNEPPPRPVAAGRPSKEDLAALDALLNPAASRGPGQSLPPAQRSGRWEPQFRPPATSARRPSRKQQGSKLPLFLLMGVLVLGAAGGASWYFKLFNSPTKKPVGKPPGPAASAAALPATPPPAPAVSPAAAPSAPAPTATAVPVLATPSPVPKPPSPPPSTPPSQGGPVAARGLLKKGSFAEAAHAFAGDLKAARGPSFSVQVLVACSTDTVQKAVESVAADELFILPVNFKGRSCFRVCWGVYDSEARADAALRALPDYFVKGGATPKVAPIATLLP